MFLLVCYPHMLQSVMQVILKLVKIVFRQKDGLIAHIRYLQECLCVHVCRRPVSAIYLATSYYSLLV